MIASVDIGALIGPEICETSEEFESCGFTLAPSSEPLGYADPLPEERRPSGEPPEGVPIRQHPDVLLDLRPEAWEIVDRFRLGRRDVTERDLHRLSNWEAEALLIMGASHSRAEIRALKKPVDPELTPP